MKLKTILLCLVIFAWPLFYLYQKQLGAISFLALSVFFFAIALKEMKKLKASMKKSSEQPKQEKIRRNSR